MKTRKHFRAEVITLSLVCLLVVQIAVCAAPRGDTSHDQEQLGPARLAGLQFERKQIHTLITIIQEKPIPGRFLMETALHSLAQLGATDALSSIDTLIQNGTGANGRDPVDSNIVNAAKAARARLVAEDADGQETGMGEQRRINLSRFYSELGETPASINAAMLAYANNSAKGARPDKAASYPVELYAIRELADMAYHSPQQDFIALPGISVIDFTLDRRSFLKVHLSPLSNLARLTWLIQDLSQKRVLTEDDCAEIQLTGDFGPEAGQAAAAKLWEIDRMSVQPPRAAFNALFGVVTMSGADEKDLWEHFKNHPNPYIAEYARRGGAREFIAGY